ncbi:MAG TPA: LLM class flavin-dependent oxidoreductase [Actinomycetota bacterium]|nr:LLM class flavin-dependent oxidoreductase [Actinomycetota bacterium]
MRPTFGVTIIPSTTPRSDPVAEAVLAEELGFDLVSVWDHPHGENPSFESWTLMTWMAARTRRITVASNVLGLPFRLPALTAKMAESLDRLSGGRLVLGLGAGASEAEFAGYGAPVRSPGEKIDALAEAIEIIRGTWSQPVFTYDGRYYRNEGALLEPKPERHIPIWLGTYGPRALELTGRVADGWIPSMRYAPPPDAMRKREIVLHALDASGRDAAAFDWAYNVSARIGGDAARDPDQQIAGEPDEVIERLVELLEMGFTTLNFWLGGRRDDQMRRLAIEVLPDVRRIVG